MIKQKIKIKKEVLILLLISLVLINFVFVIAEGVEDEDFNKYLEDIKTSGVLSKQLIDDMNKLTAVQKSKIIEQISTLDDKNKFFNQWTGEFSVEQKRELLRDNSNLKLFFQELGKNYNINLKGFSENFKDIGFGEGGIVGNSKIFLDLEKLKLFNSRTENPITELELSSTFETLDGFSIKRKNGESASIVLPEDKALSGYYFDAENLRFYKLKDVEGSVVPDDSSGLSGTWNGNGNIIIDASGKEVKMTLDALRKDGKASEENTAQFTSVNGDRYSVYQKPGKDKDGKEVYNINKGEIVFGEDGRPKSFSDIYYDGSKFSSFFGKDTKIMYSKEAFDKLSSEEKAKLGSYVVIDEEKGYIAGNIKRVATGIGKTVGDSLEENARKIADSLAKLELSKLSPMDVRKAIAADLNKNIPTGGLFGEKFTENDEIVKYLATPEGNNDMGILLNGLKGFVSTANDALALFSDSPAIIAQVPDKDALLIMQVKNDFAKNLKDVNFKGGMLDIQDNTGSFVRVVNSANPNNFDFNKNFNQNNPRFNNINFNLYNDDFPDKVIQVFAQSGKLEARGIGFGEGFDRVGSLEISATGTVYLGARGRLKISQTEGVAEFGLNVDSETAAKARTYLEEAAAEYNVKANFYNKEAEKYNSAYNGEDPEVDPTTREDTQYIQKLYQDLMDLRNKQTYEYYKILNEGNSNLYIQSLTRKTGEFVKSVDQLSEALDSLATSDLGEGERKGTEGNTIGLLMATAVDRIRTDKAMQDSLAQRGLSSVDDVQGLVVKEVKNIAQFLKENSGTRIEINKDVKNNLYQLKYGTKTMNLDTAVAPVVTDILPIVLGSGGVNEEGKFYINPNIDFQNRLLGDSRVGFGASYGPVRILAAAANRKGIESAIKDKIIGQVGQWAKTPANQ